LRNMPRLLMRRRTPALARRGSRALCARHANACPRGGPRSAPALSCECAAAAVAPFRAAARRRQVAAARGGGAAAAQPGGPIQPAPPLMTRAAALLHGKNRTARTQWRRARALYLRCIAFAFACERRTHVRAARSRAHLARGRVGASAPSAAAASSSSSAIEHAARARCLRPRRAERAAHHMFTRSRHRSRCSRCSR
jgi:hypothetical protein